MTEDEVERRGGVDLTLAGDGSQQLSLVIGKQIVVGLVVNFLFMQNLVGRSEYIFLVKLTLWGAVETVEDFLHIPRLTVNHIIQVDEGFLRHFSLLLGVSLLGLLNLFTKTLFAHIIESPNIYASALRFMDFRQWGIIFVSVNFLFRALYVGLSNTKIISITTLLMAGVNIFFDYALIFGHFGFPEMGVAGAGLSSVLAEITAFVTFFAYTFIKLPYKNYNLFTFEKFDGGLLKSVLRISLPTMFQRLVSFGSWFLFFAMIEHLGEEEMAISGIVRSVYMLCTLSVFAFGTTANTVTSRLIGAGKTDEIPQTLRRILKMSLLILLPILVFFVLFPQQIASIYTDDAALALKSVPVLYTIYVGAVVMAAAMIYFEFVSGTGNTFLALVMETGVLVFYIIYIYLATQVFCFPIRWVWCSEWVYSVLMLVASLVFMKVHPWREKTGVTV